MDNREVWQFIKENLQNDKNVILISVLESRGGSPGKAGFKLAVSENAQFGTIGGGVM